MSLLGVVLAGGRSSRMGRDKAELVWHGQSLLERQAHLLKQAGCGAVLMAGRQVTGWPSLPDAQPFRGPVAAIANMMNQIHAMFSLIPGKIIIAPVDMPLLTPAALQSLLIHPSPLVAYAENPLPCVMRITPDLQQKVTTYAKQPGASLKGLWDIIPEAVWLPRPKQTGFLTNINTPDDWAALQNMKDVSNS